MLERYYQELLNFFTRTARSRDAAAELVQESYARVLALQRSGQPVPEPRALLYRTARNLQVDQYRRGCIRGEGVVPDAASPLDELDQLAAPPAFEPDTAAASGQAVTAMLATIDALPLRCREAFLLHKFDGMPHAEVAARMASRARGSSSTFSRRCRPVTAAGTRTRAGLKGARGCCRRACRCA